VKLKYDFLAYLGAFGSQTAVIIEAYKIA